MVTGNTKVFEDLVDFLKVKRENVTFIDIIRLAEVAASSLQSFFETFDVTVYRELREIAGYIDSMRDQIGELGVNDMKNSRLPAAGQELGAIVKATETATDTIMTCAESVMAADASDPAAYKAMVDEKMMTIFEACSFQDITGQRIARVVETLQHIEQRVARFAQVMKAKDLDGFLSDDERVRAERKERLLLHGPATDGQGVDQQTIDKMIEKSDDKGSQASIDKLFA
jgi:chemotaxis protein CheZ